MNTIALFFIVSVASTAMPGPAVLYVASKAVSGDPTSAVGILKVRGNSSSGNSGCSEQVPYRRVRTTCCQPEGAALFWVSCATVRGSHAPAGNAAYRTGVCAFIDRRGRVVHVRSDLIAFPELRCQWPRQPCLQSGCWFIVHWCRRIDGAFP